MNEQLTRWCPIHEAEVAPWVYEPELGRELCAKCYNEHYEAEDAELWGDE